MPEILEILMGSKSRARVMRFFVLNPGKNFLFAEIREKTQIPTNDVRKLVASFIKVNLVKTSTREGKKYYTLNDSFTYYNELRNLFVKSNVYPHCTEVKRIKDVGSIKLVMISGVFMNYNRAEIDLLIVGDDMDRKNLIEVISAIEAEIGHEVKYMALNVEDFHYRLEMMDRFLIEFFAGPHDAIINKISKLSRFISEIKR